MASQTLSQKSINRREFLYYIGGASAALAAAGSCAGITLLATPRLRSGVDYFEIDVADVPALSDLSSPVWYPDFQGYLSHVDQGLLALSDMCTWHDKNRLLWVDQNNRFICPDCGSMFWKDGTGDWSHDKRPAPRGMDRFVVEVTTPEGIIRTPDDGSPVRIDGATRVVIYPNEKILGDGREKTVRYLGG